MKVVLIGYGNIGKELRKVLEENNIFVELIVKTDGIYDGDMNKINEKDTLFKYIDDKSIVFISVPSKKDLSILNYYIKSLEMGAWVITCEKATISNNWDLIEKYPNKIKYSASVGGGSGILNAITEYTEEIKEIRAVVNGTLNYISHRIAEGATNDEVCTEVINKGFAEPSANNFEEVIKGELNDVRYKATILANHSKLYKDIQKPQDIIIEEYSNGKRCQVILTKDGIKAGFLNSEDIKWFPSGINNILYVNGRKIVEGPGAGSRATAEKMLEDYKTLLSNKIDF